MVKNIVLGIIAAFVFDKLISKAVGATTTAK